MAIQLPQRTGLGAILGAGLGTGLQKGQQQQGLAQALQGLNVPPQKAKAIASLPPELQKQFISEFGLPQQAQQQQPQGIEQLLSGLSPDQQQQLLQQLQGAQQQQPQGAQGQAEPSVLQSKTQRRQQQKEQQFQQQLQEKKAARVERANAPFLKEFDKNVEANSKIHDLAQESLRLVETGKVASGLKGLAAENLPAFLSSANDETQQASALMNRIAKEEIAKGGGRLSQPIIKFAQGLKPALRQSTSAQKRLLQGLIKETKPFVIKDKIKDQLIQENNGQPANIKAAINRRFKALEQLPDGVQEGTRLQDDDGTQFIFEDGILKKVA